MRIRIAMAMERAMAAGDLTRRGGRKMIEMGGFEPGVDAFADEVGEENVLAGDGEGFKAGGFFQTSLIK